MNWINIDRDAKLGTILKKAEKERQILSLQQYSVFTQSQET